jgi:AbrB family looped-hinge helix DNA binding protein
MGGAAERGAAGAALVGVDEHGTSLYHFDMAEPCTTTVDAAGRLVLPAVVRRELALVGGTELEVEVVGGMVCLRPLARAPLATRGRLLVVAGALAGPVPDHRALRDERTERLDGS